MPRAIRVSAFFRPSTFGLRPSTFGLRICPAAAQNVFGPRETEPQFLATLDRRSAPHLNSRPPRDHKKERPAVTFSLSAYRPRPAPRLFPGFSGAWADGFRWLLGTRRAGLTHPAPRPSLAPRRGGSTFRTDPPTPNTTRNPLLSLRLSGGLLLRYDESRFRGSLLFHEPPRNTRVRPSSHFRQSRLTPGGGAEICHL